MMRDENDRIREAVDRIVAVSTRRQPTSGVAPGLWTGIVRIYDAEFDILEAARGEFDRTAETLVGALAARMDELRAGLGSFGELQPAPPRVDRDPVCGGWTARLPLRWGRTLELEVLGRLARPWGGPAATLRLGIARGRMHRVLTRMGMARRLAEIAGGRPRMPEPDTDGWLAVRTVDAVGLTEKSVSQLGDILEELIVFALTVLDTAAAETRVVRNALEALLDCQEAIEREPIGGHRLFPRWHRDPRSPWACDLYSMRLVRPRRPAIWVGLRLESRELVYGHEPTEVPELAETLARLLNCKPATIGEPAGGVLMDEKALALAGRRQLTDRCLEVFRVFTELTARPSR